MSIRLLTASLERFQRTKVTKITQDKINSDTSPGRGASDFWCARGTGYTYLSDKTGSIKALS